MIEAQPGALPASDQDYADLPGGECLVTAAAGLGQGEAVL